MWWLALAVVTCFAGVVAFGAPYLPSFRKDIEDLIDAAGVKSGQRLLELGCGDGKVLLVAAERGITCVGYELNPILWLIAWLRTRKYRNQVLVRLGSFWQADFNQTDVVYTFLFTRFMPELERRMQKTHGVMLISYIYELPHTRPTRKTRNGYIYQF